MSSNPIARQLRTIEDYRNAQLYGHAVMRQFSRAAGMTFDQVVDDLDAALLSRDRPRLNDFFASRQPA